MERGRKMTENIYKTSCGGIRYFVNIIDKQKTTLVFLPGLTADHRLFEKQIEYFEKKQNVFVWDAPSHALSRPFTNNYSLSDMAEWLYEKIIKNMQGLLVLVTECLLGQSKQICHIILVVRHFLSVAKRIKQAQPKAIIKNGIREKVYPLSG